eukprot:g16493.t1
MSHPIRLLRLWACGLRSGMVPKILRRVQELSAVNLTLPDLTNLDLSNCPVQSSAEDLLQLLARSRHLATLKASNAGLHGSISSEVEDLWFFESLKTLDFSWNNITEFTSLPGVNRVLYRLQHNHHLWVDKEILKKAVQSEIILDLANTELVNLWAAEQLLHDGVFKLTDDLARRDETNGYGCQDLIDGSLHVTPSMFLPKELCRCMPGDSPLISVLNRERERREMQALSKAL